MDSQLFYERMAEVLDLELTGDEERDRWLVWDATVNVAATAAEAEIERAIERRNIAYQYLGLMEGTAI